jgi:serine protease Do
MLAWSLRGKGKIAAGALAAVALAAGGIAALSYKGEANAQQPATARPAQTQPVDRPGLSGDDFSALAKRLMPSVVNISTRQNVTRGDGLPEFGQNSPLREFNDLLGRGDRGGARRQSSLGSGFIIDATGYVVTNNHVIDGADEIQITLSDGTELPAKLIGTDTDVDLALLKVEPRTPLTPVPWGNSDAADVGQWAMAIGNPFGLGGTVTVGIISARSRDIGASAFDDFIQTDAAINKGNSGGPLFNLRGEVIGVNTAIISPGNEGGSVGVGFSVPANFAKAVVGQLKEFKSARRGSMGVTVDSVDQRVAEAYGLNQAGGAILKSVTKGGAAEAGGLKAGDLITSLNGQQIKEARDIFRIMGVTQAGANVAVKYRRGGREATTTVKLTASSPDAVANKTPERDAAKELSNLLGVKFRPITDDDRRRYRIPNSIRGVMVQQVETGSDATGKLQTNMVVTAVNFQPVSSPEQAISAAEAAKAAKKTVLLEIWNADETIFVGVRPK